MPAYQWLSIGNKSRPLNTGGGQVENTLAEIGELMAAGNGENAGAAVPADGAGTVEIQLQRQQRAL